MSVGEQQDGAGQAVATEQPAGLAEQEPIAVESMCPRCGANGTTRLLMLDIPHFREIVLMVSKDRTNRICIRLRHDSSSPSSFVVASCVVF